MPKSISDKVPYRSVTNPSPKITKNRGWPSLVRFMKQLKKVTEKKCSDEKPAREKKRSLDIKAILKCTFTVGRGNYGYEKADFLARITAEEGMSFTGSLTFNELYSLKKIELNQRGRTPPCYP
ncbi:hypothetical protein TNCV_3376841 [Trichonephila clavipes]|nr:hypothetical protein TNCV_3376841 [Trichonephila clavipes]